MERLGGCFQPAGPRRCCPATIVSGSHPCTGRSCTLDPPSYLWCFSPSALINLCREEVRAAFCLHCILISTPPLYSLYPLYSSVSCTNSAEVHRCRVSFCISGATAWTDDQIRLIASICMFLLIWKEKRFFTSTATAGLRWLFVWVLG